MFMPVVNIRRMGMGMLNGFMFMGMRMEPVGRDFPFGMVVGMMIIVVAVAVFMLHKGMKVRVFVFFP